MKFAITYAELQEYVASHLFHSRAHRSRHRSVVIIMYKKENVLWTNV